MTAVDDVRAAFEVVLRDFQHPTPVDLPLEVGREGGAELIWVSTGDGSRVGHWIDEDATEAELLVRVADFLQDHVFDQLPQAWGEPRPRCPGHQHPLDPRLVDGRPWWVCPRSGDRLGRIGELG